MAKNSDFQSRSSSVPTDVQGAWGYPQQARQALSGHRHCMPLCAAISRGTACEISVKGVKGVVQINETIAKNCEK